jgi:hypothetical protein
MKRDTQEFFDWCNERIDKFEKMYSWARITSWGTGVGIEIKDSQVSTHLPIQIFLKLIGEDKSWWEY